MAKGRCVWEQSTADQKKKHQLKHRKSGSTLTEEHNPEAAESVASLLTHSTATSKKHYRLTNKEKFALRGTRELEKVFNRNLEDGEQLEKRKKV